MDFSIALLLTQASAESSWWPQYPSMEISPILSRSTSLSSNHTTMACSHSVFCIVTEISFFQIVYSWVTGSCDPPCLTAHKDKHTPFPIPLITGLVATRAILRPWAEGSLMLSPEFPLNKLLILLHIWLDTPTVTKHLGHQASQMSRPWLKCCLWRPLLIPPRRMLLLCSQIRVGLRDLTTSR